MTDNIDIPLELESKLVLKIGGFTPETIPMNRLAEYMADFAKLLGEVKGVHFKEVRPGSAELVAEIEQVAQPKVARRLYLVSSGEGPEDALKAQKAIDDKLRDDNTSGSIFGFGKRGEIIAFPGITRPIGQVYGPITQNGTVSGTVIRVGGKDRTIPVLLQAADGKEIKCNTTRAIAMELAKSLFAGEVRCNGIGKWLRDADGIWLLQGFVISGFEILEERSVLETVSELRTVEGSGWRKIGDPWQELSQLRSDESETE